MRPIHPHIEHKEGLLKYDVIFTVCQGRSNIEWLVAVVTYYFSWPMLCISSGNRFCSHL